MYPSQSYFFGGIRNRDEAYESLTQAVRHLLDLPDNTTADPAHSISGAVSAGVYSALSDNYNSRQQAHSSTTAG